MVDWTPFVTLRDGRVARYNGLCELTRKHRVVTYQSPRGPVSAKEVDGRYDLTYTTWLLDDLGRARGDRGPCGEDYANAA